MSLAPELNRSIPYRYTLTPQTNVLVLPSSYSGLLCSLLMLVAAMVLVTNLDRAFRSAKDTYDNLAYLDSHKVGFIAATQPIDTSTSTRKLLLGVLAAVAEFEKALIVERTKEGLARAKAQGKRLGRPPGSKDKRKRSRRGYLLRWAE